MTIPFSPLADIIGRWPVSYLDAIHQYLLNNAGFPTFASKVINGGFDIWQEGPGPFTASGYTADQWVAAIGGGATVAYSRVAFALGQTDIPGEPTYFGRMARSVVGAAASSWTHRIESVRTFAGQSLSVSFYAKASVAQSINLNLVQNFGTGGAPSGSVTTALASFAVTTAWQLFTFSGVAPSIAGKTLGTNNNDFIDIQFELPIAAGVVTLDLANIDARASATPGTFEYLPLSQTLAFCQRYYEKTFQLSVAPAQNTLDSQGALCMTGQVVNQRVGCWWNFKTRKRVSPTITTYSPNAASANWSTNGGAPTAALQFGGENGVYIAGTTSVIAGNDYGIHATANARL